MKIYTRNEWKARSARWGRYRYQDAHNVQRIFLHYTQTSGRNLKTFEAQKRTIRSIQAYHMDKGWTDIGYHYIVFQPWGRQMRARVYQGRPISAIPTAQANANTNTIAIAVVMSDNEPLRLATRIKLRALVRDVRKRIHRKAVVLPHSAVNDTSCPGANLRRFIRTLK